MKRLAWSAAIALAAVAFWAAHLPAADPAPPAAPDSTAGTHDWPQWRGPARNGISSENIKWPAAGPKRLWKAEVGVGYSSVSVSNGRAYTMGTVDGQETVWCLDARTGAVIWKYAIPVPVATGNLTPKPKTPDGFQDPYRGPNATPTVDGNLVYTVSHDGLLSALDAVKGTLVWSADYMKDFGGKKQRWGHASSPLVDGDLLLVNVGVEGASVVAFNKTTGKVVWKSGYDEIGFASPMSLTVGGQRMVVMFSATGLFAYNLPDGKSLWNVEWAAHSQGNAVDPIIFGDKIFISSEYGVGCCLLKFTSSGATEVYRKKNYSSHFPSPVMVDGMIYGISGHINSKPSLVCYDPNTGDIKWEKRAAGTELIAAGKTLLVQSPKGNLVAVEATPEAYREIGSAPALGAGVCWTPPSLANGRVYCRSGEGEVVCLDLIGAPEAVEPPTQKTTEPPPQPKAEPAAKPTPEAPPEKKQTDRGTNEAPVANVPAEIGKAMQLPAGKERDKVVFPLALEWLKQDPTAALTWALSLPSGTSNKIRLYVIGQGGAIHGKLAADLMLQKKSYGSLHYAMHFWATVDPGPALEWCLQAPDEVRHLSFASLGDGWTYTDAAAAAAGFSKIKATEDRCSMAYGICKAWTWAHPQDAAAATTWAAGLASPEERRSAFYGIGQGWSRKHLPAATAWIKTLKNQDEVRAAAYGAVKMIQTGLVERPSSAEGAKDAELYDRAYAKEWLDQLPLSDAEKTAILDGPTIGMKDTGKVPWPK